MYLSEKGLKAVDFINRTQDTNQWQGLQNNDNEFPWSIRYKEFLNYLSNYHLLKNNSAL